MSRFPFFDLPPVFQEKVISKVDCKAYFRLQQTNSSVNEFIRTSKHISIHLDGKYFLGFNGAVWHLCVIKNGRPLHITTEVLHGVRFELLEARLGSAEECQYLCDLLLKNNITCKKVGIYDIVGWNIEQCGAFLKAIKPENVVMISAGTDKFEAILQSKTVKIVEAYLDSNVAEMAVTKFLPSVEKLTICVSNTLNFTTIKSIITLLLSKSYPKLRNFYLQGDKETDKMPSKAELEELFNEFNVTVEVETEKQSTVRIQIPPHIPQEFTCKLVINTRNRNLVYIHFGMTDDIPIVF